MRRLTFRKKTKFNTLTDLSGKLWVVSVICLFFGSIITPHTIIAAEAKLVIQRYSPKIIRHFAVSPDQQRIGIIRGDDFGRGYAYEILRANDGKLIHTGPLPEFEWLFMGQNFSTNMKYILYCSGRMNPAVIDLENEYKVIKVTDEKRDNCYGAAASSEGTIVLFFQEEIEIFKLNKEKIPQAYKKIKIKNVAGTYTLKEISPDGKFIAFSEYDGKITVYDIENQKEIFSKGSKFLFMGTHSSTLKLLQFSDDGKFLISQDKSGKIFVHNMAGDKTDEKTFSETLFYVKTDSQGRIESCPSLILPLAPESTTGRACVPDHARLPISTNEKDNPRIYVGKFAQLFQVQNQIKYDLVEKVTTKELILKPVEKGVTPVTISLSHLKLLSGWNVYADAPDRNRVVIKQSRPPAPGIMVAYKFYALKINGDKAEIISESKDDMLSASFAATEPGGYAYAWYNFLIFYSEKQKKDINAQAPPIPNDGYQSLRYSIKHKILIANARNQLVSWNNEGKLLNYTGEAANFTELFLTENEDMFITSSEDGSIGIWDVQTLNKLATFYGDEKNWVVAARDGRFEYAGTGIEKLHYVSGNEIIEMKDFDASLMRKDLIREILSGKKFVKILEPTKITKENDTKPNTDQKPDVRKSLAGKVHSVSQKEVVLGGTGYKIGEKVYVIHNGKKIRLKIHFPLHTSAKAKPEKNAELKLVKKGMPVFR